MHDHAPVVLQLGGDDALHIGCRDLAVTLDILRQKAGVAEVLVVLIELVRQTCAANFFDAAQHCGFDRIAGALHFLVARRRAAQLIHFFVDRGFDFLRAMAGTSGDIDDEYRGQCIRFLGCIDVLRDLLVIDQRLVQPARFSACQNLRRNTQFGVTLLVRGRCQPAHEHARQFDPICYHRAALGRDWRRDDAQLRNIGSAFEVAEIFPHQRFCLGLVDVADDDQAGVVGSVITSEKSLDVIQLGGLDIGM